MPTPTPNADEHLGFVFYQRGNGQLFRVRVLERGEVDAAQLVGGAWHHATAWDVRTRHLGLDCDHWTVMHQPTLDRMRCNTCCTAFRLDRSRNAWPAWPTYCAEHEVDLVDSSTARHRTCGTEFAVAVRYDREDRSWEMTDAELVGEHYDLCPGCRVSIPHEAVEDAAREFDRNAA